MSLRQAAEMACATLDHAAAVADRPGLMDMCEKAAEILRAALAEADEPVACFYQHSETGRVLFIPTDDRMPMDSNWKFVSYLYTHPPRREPLTEMKCMRAK